MVGARSAADGRCKEHCRWSAQGARPLVGTRSAADRRCKERGRWSGTTPDRVSPRNTTATRGRRLSPTRRSLLSPTTDSCFHQPPEVLPHQCVGGVLINRRKRKK